MSLPDEVLSVAASSAGLLLSVIVVPALGAVPPVINQQDSREIRVCCQHFSSSRLALAEISTSVRRRCLNFRIEDRAVASMQDATTSLLEHQKSPTCNINEGDCEADSGRH